MSPSSLKTPPVLPPHCSAIPELNQSAQRTMYREYGPDGAVPGTCCWLGAGTNMPYSGSWAAGRAPSSSFMTRYGSSLTGWGPGPSSSVTTQSGGRGAGPGCRSAVRAHSRTEDGMSRPRSRAMSVAGSSGAISRSPRVNAHKNPSRPSSPRCAACTRRIELPRVFRTGNLRLFHAASCPFRYSSRTSCGVRYPSVEWRRVLL